MSARRTVFPIAPGGLALPFEELPVTIDGMKVQFDVKVAVFPVELEESSEASVQRPRPGGSGRRRNGRR